MAGHPPGDATDRLDLIGRGDVLTALRDLISGGPRSAVVVGIAGSGKTTLLSAVERETAGAAVIRVTGHAAEANLPYASLIDLLTSGPDAQHLLDRLEHSAPATPPDALDIRLGVVQWLASRAARGRVLVLLDDFQWFDDVSASVFAFVMRRLSRTDVSMVATVRGDAPPPCLAGLPRLDLLPLTHPQSLELLRRSQPELDAPSQGRVVAAAAGNPLALIELGRSARRGRDGAEGWLPSSVEAAFASEVASLPPACRHALLLAAAGANDLGILGRVIHPRLLLQVLAPAEEVGLVRVEANVVSFRHPLARAAVYAGATAQARVRAHEALSLAYRDDPDRCAWHRSEAAIAPDDGVAQEMLEVAERAHRRGANLEAATATMRAAQFTSSRADREMRMLQALALGVPAGQLRWLADAAAKVRDQSDDASVRAMANHYVAFALARTTEHREAQSALEKALAQLLDTDVTAAWFTLTTLAYLTYASGSGRDRLGRWLDRLLAAVPDDDENRSAVEPARVYVRAVCEPLAYSAEVAAMVLKDELDEDAETSDLALSREALLGATALTIDDIPTALRRLSTTVRVMRRTSRTGQLTQVLSGLGVAQLEAGLLDEADETGRHLIDLAEAERLTFIANTGRELRARVAGLRGDADTVHEMVALARSDRADGASTAVEAQMHKALASLSFHEGDSDGCYHELRYLFDLDGEPMHPHISYGALGDLVAAAVRARRQDEVTGVMELAEERLRCSGPRMRFQLLRAQALLRVDDAEDLHRAAVAMPEAQAWPIQLMSARLEFGTWLRRQRRAREAGTHLRAVVDMAARLRTPAWEAIARVELRASGVATEPAPDALHLLTPQQREVVRLAAAGLSNREISERLFLSVRTVGTHLYRAFPKLGVSHRRQLAGLVTLDD